MTLPQSPSLPILVILKDAARVALFRHLAEQSRRPVIEAPGALHALTQLERTPVAAIICDSEMEDMSGSDFREVVAAEDHSKGVPVYILSSTNETDPAPNELSVTTPQLLGQVLTDLEVSPDEFPLPINPGVAPHLHGDLSQFSLPEFLNWVAEMRFSGHWMVTVSTPQGAAHPLTGYLAMRDGNAVYAECGTQTGKAALFSLLHSIDKYHDAIFRFYRSEVPASTQSPDMRTTTPRLLIELAVDLDHYAAGHGPMSH